LTRRVYGDAAGPAAIHEHPAVERDRRENPGQRGASQHGRADGSGGIHHLFTGHQIDRDHGEGHAGALEGRVRDQLVEIAVKGGGCQQGGLVNRDAAVA
jgi:hypothetical protein